MKTDIKTKAEPQRLALKIIMTVLAAAAVVIAVAMLASGAVFYSNFNSIVNDYVFVAALTCAFMLELFIPVMFERVFKIRISPVIGIVFILHCFGGTFLGNVANMFYIIPFWDSIMHFVIGVNLGMLGLALAQFYARSSQGRQSALFTAAIALFTALALSTFWELFEFAADVLLDVNMQRYAEKTGEMLVGQAALMDTMLDFVLDTAGALLVAVPVYFSIRLKKNWHTLCDITKNKAHSAQENINR